MAFISSLWRRVLGIGPDSRKKVEWLLPYAENRRVLDLGFAGEGGLVTGDPTWVHGHLNACAQKCLGLDHNREAVAFYRNLGYEVMAGDIQQISLEGEFDTVFACDVLEHLDDPKGFFESVTRVLAPDGYLVLTVPNPWFYLRFFRCLFKGSPGVNPDHVFWFCQDTIRELLRRYGFKIITMQLGSGQCALYRLFFLPKVLRHTSIFVAAKRNGS